MLLQFMLSVWCGANRFAQTEVTRHDPVLKKLFGFKRMANFKAIMRLFGKFDQATNMRVFGQLYRWFFGNLYVDGLTLDLDSTVMTRYGQQEGAARVESSQAGALFSSPFDGLCFGYSYDSESVAAAWQQP
ncbi:MAG TPA: hypothetical protein V6D48_09405 [Oculatellaceae cyanobacterium]